MENVKTNSPHTVDELFRAIEARELACAEAAESGDRARLTSLWVEGEELKRRLMLFQDDLRRSYRQARSDEQCLRAWAVAQNDSAT